MWKVLGKDVVYLDIAPAWTERILELSRGYESEERFRELVGRTTVQHMFNGSTEMHSMMIDVPKEFEPEDIQFMADIILVIAKDNIDAPFISLEGKYQKCQVIINNEEEPELLGMNKTEGYSSGKIFLPILESLSGPGRPNDSLM